MAQRLAFGFPRGASTAGPPPACLLSRSTRSARLAVVAGWLLCQNSQPSPGDARSHQGNGDII